MHFWPPFMFYLVICAFIVGTVKHIPFTTICIGSFAGGTILNMGVFFLIRTMRAHLLNLPECPEREEAHKDMVNIILRRLKRGH